MKSDDEYTAEDWEWVARRAPGAPLSIWRLVLAAIDNGWCCWDVSKTAGRVTLRNFQHRERTGIVYEVDLVWCNGKHGPRFARGDLNELRLDVESSRTIAGAEGGLK